MSQSIDTGATVENASVPPQPMKEENIEEFDDRLVELLHPEIEVESRRGRRSVYRPRRDASVPATWHFHTPGS